MGERRLGALLSGLAWALYPLLLWRGWGRWNDVLVDYGRELYVPWRLGQGDVLYRDLAYFNGPLSPHWNALWFGLMGDSLRTLTLVNGALAALFALLLQRCLKTLAGPIAAGAALLFFFPVFACGHFPGTGNYNFLSPYSHEITHGLLLALGALTLALGGRLEGGMTRACAAGFLLGLCFLTKAEVFLAGAGAVLWVFLLSARGEGPRLGKRAACLCAWALVAPGIAFCALWSAMPAAAAARGTLGSWAFLLGGASVQSPFYGALSGLDHLSLNLRGLGSNFAWLALLFVPAAGLDRLLAPRPLAWKLCGAALYAAGLGVLFTRLDWSPFDWMFSVRSAPLIALLVALACGLAALRGEGAERRRWADRSAFAVFALLLLLKILLAAILCQYGFALAVCALALLLALLLEWLPRALGPGGTRGLVLRSATLAWLVSTAGAFWAMSEGSFAAMTVPVGEGPDRFWADPLRGEGVRAVLGVIDERLGPEDTLLVLPEGITINYLTRRRAPTRHINFMPPELEMFGESRIRRELREAPDPAACVLVHKDTREYGVALFGIDYGEALMGWVRRRYRPDWLYGEPPLEPGTRFGIGFLGPR